jgi:Tfp pilus assembly protein PilO
MKNSSEKSLISFDRIIHAVGLAALLATAGVAWVLVLQPIEQRRMDCDKRIGELEPLLVSSSDVEQHHRELTEQRDEIEQRAAAFRERIPDQPHEAEFLGQIAQLADRVGLLIRDYRPGTSSTCDSYSQLEVLLAGEGTYASICGFLDELGKLSRLTSVARLEITTQHTSDIYPVTMTLVIYYGAGRDNETNAKKA